MVERHTHSGTDSPKIDFKDIDIVPQPAVTGTASAAGATYDATTQATINTLISQVNQLKLIIRNQGLSL